jgi:hypothetical protein
MKSEYDLELQARYNREEMQRAVARYQLADLAQQPKGRTLRRRLAAVLVAVLVVALALAVALGWTPRVASAAGPITVTSTADVIANDGPGTLREAISAAEGQTAPTLVNSAISAHSAPAGSGGGSALRTTCPSAVRGSA